MIIHIPIRNHLLKYLQCKVGSNQIELQKVSQEKLFAENCNARFFVSEVSKIIFRFITTNEKNSWKQKQIDNALSNYSLCAVMIKDWLIDSKRVYFSYKGVTELNNAIDELFVSELTNLEQECIVMNRRIDLAIIDFMDKYNITEDDIKFDSLKKRAYRERVQLKEKVFIHRNLLGKQAVLDLSFTAKLIKS